MHTRGSNLTAEQIRTEVTARAAAQAIAHQQDADERGWSIDEAVNRLGIGKSMTYELLASGELESITIGRRRIIPESAIRSFFAARLAASRAERAGVRQ